MRIRTNRLADDSDKRGVTTGRDGVTNEVVATGTGVDGVPTETDDPDRECVGWGAGEAGGAQEDGGSGSGVGALAVGVGSAGGATFSLSDT